MERGGRQQDLASDREVVVASGVGAVAFASGDFQHLVDSADAVAVAWLEFAGPGLARCQPGSCLPSHRLASRSQTFDVARFAQSGQEHQVLEDLDLERC